jgi:hypothetical protein
LGGIRAEGAGPPPAVSFTHKYSIRNCQSGKAVAQCSGSGIGRGPDDTAPSAGHRRRSARAVPHTVNDDFITGHFVEDQVWIRASDETAQALAAGSGAQVGVVKREVDEPLNTGLHLARAVGRLRLDKRAPREDRLSREACNGVSKPVLRPDSPHFFIRRELSAISLGKRFAERSLFLRCQFDDGLILTRPIPAAREQGRPALQAAARAQRPPHARKAWSWRHHSTTSLPEAYPT